METNEPIRNKTPVKSPPDDELKNAVGISLHSPLPAVDADFILPFGAAFSEIRVYRPPQHKHDSRADHRILDDAGRKECGEVAKIDERRHFLALYRHGEIPSVEARLKLVSVSKPIELVSYHFGQRNIHGEKRGGVVAVLNAPSFKKQTS